MKFYRNLCLVAVCSLLVSCFKEEPLNAECDILEVRIADNQLQEMFFNETERQIEVLSGDSIINFKVRRKADLNAIAPLFKITEGATIQPANGSTHDFSKGSVTYTVTSEDKQWSRRYKVSFIPTSQTVKDTIHFDFEHFRIEPTDKKFYLWYDFDENGKETDYWATGNIAFSIAAGDKSADEYPSVPVSEGGHHGAYVRLTTRSTGALGAMFGKPIAAGNIFFGKFDAGQSLVDPNKATQFGIPFDKKPIKFTGWYKYQPGKNFQNQQQKILKDRTDQAAIYAVLYRNTVAEGEGEGKSKKIVLDGNNILTSEHIVAIAQMENIKTTSEWTPFDISFQYHQPIDENIVENRGYNLAIVFSSSRDGAKFEGAIGSELCIDDIRIICTSEE